MEALLLELKTMLNESFELELQELDLDDSLTLTYGLNSIQLVQLAMQIHELYDVELGDVLHEIDSVGELIAAIETRRGQTLLS